MISMEREIKFRAWEVKNKKWLEEGWSLSMDGVYWYDDNEIERPVKGVIDIMQYTGLKDKNGVDIYEGDIVKTSTDKPMVIGWSVKFASFVIDREDWMFSHWFGESCNPEDLEVIGNIYENPELFNTTKQ